jgi:hypothetical protein
MNSDRLQPKHQPEGSHDARDLLARLYREIGISAVAAALQVPERKPEPARIDPRNIPGVLRGNDIAA